MYFVLHPKWEVWRDEIVQAQLDPPIPDHEMLAWYRAWYADEPFPRRPRLTFRISSEAPLLDNYFTSADIEMYSDKLVSMLRSFDINFETFPVRILDRATGNMMPVSYHAVHLMETIDGVDYDQSLIERMPFIEIERLVLSTSCTNANRPMFRLKGLEFITVIRADVQSVLQQGNITGFDYIPTNEFRVGPKNYQAKLRKQTP